MSDAIGGRGGTTVAVVGAGLAGLTAARRLISAGAAVTVFEKSRGLGGRVATRRSDAGTFDHGAPLLHGLDADTAGCGVAWRDGIVGVPGASSIGRQLGAGLEVRRGARVVGVSDAVAGWTVHGADGPLGAFDILIIAAPSPQAAALVSGARWTELRASLMRPGWTLMATFDRPVPGDGWRDDLPGPLGLAIREASKPDRPAAEAWVIHADDDFADRELEAQPDVVAAALLTAFRDATGAPEPAFSVAHRWRYARTARPLGAPFLWDEWGRIGFAGDWCLGARAGDAVSSGRALAAAIAA